MAISQLPPVHNEFRLLVRVDIEKLYVDARGASVGSPERMAVSEEFQIRASGFTEIAAVLGQFNELAARIRQAPDTPRPETSA